MKKYCFIVLGLSLLYNYSYAQELKCVSRIEEAKKLISENSPFNDEDVIFELVEPCAVNQDAEALNLLGVLYLKGIGTEKNASKAFGVIKKAAEQGHASAQYNLGRMYKTGEGCTINFSKAIEWFEKSSANGNQRATYSLGYMYYKGFGVNQDYEKALNWFKKSDDPMAKHFLGLSYYQGYGVPVDEDKSLEVLLNNDIVNSATLISYIKSNQRENTERTIAQVLESDDNSNIANLKEVSTTSFNELSDQELVDSKDMQGDWIGKLIQYDWSGEKIERIVPIELSFKGANEAINITYNFLGKKENTKASLQDDYMYFKTPFNFTLDKLYSSNPKELSLDYEVLSMNFKKQKLSNRTYLIGSVDTYIDNWKEYGQPTRIVLRSKNGTDSEIGDEENEEMLLALAAQEDHFIKLYPIPFREQLTVQYQLDTDADVYIELLGINGGDPIVVLPKKHQQAGDYTHTVPVNASLKQGYYVVRLTAGDQLYTRLIIKENL